jgi:hypothetical protein
LTFFSIGADYDTDELVILIQSKEKCSVAIFGSFEFCFNAGVDITLFTAELLPQNQCVSSPLPIRNAINRVSVISKVWGVVVKFKA